MDPAGLDLQAYFRRIGWTGDPVPGLATLASLQLAHLGAIPFENLDVQVGRPIRLDLESLQAKLVHGRRGGYCFEQNSLFAAVLERLGFQVSRREARVRRGASRLLPRTHLSLQVRLPEGAFLADVGFGADAPMLPVPYDGTEASGFGQAWRVAAEGPLRVLQARQPDGWLDLYAVEPAPVHPVDLEMANHYTSTHPDSRFVQTLTAQLCTPEARWILRNLELTTFQGIEVRTEPVAEPDLLPLLRRRFGLDLPDGTRFRFLGEPGPQ
jgi:N-hydroxyarylamine O-acetyltransferase